MDPERVGGATVAVTTSTRVGDLGINHEQVTNLAIALSRK